MVSFSDRKIVVGILVFVIGITVSISGIIFVKRMKSNKDVSVYTEEVIEEKKLIKKDVIGKSVEGRDIELYSYGSGEKHLLFVGGVHGGYEWNSVLLAYKVIDYFDLHYESIPSGITINIIPSLNPDGVYKVTGKVGRFSTKDTSVDETILASGRFNANDVDVNRNFDCKWQSKSTWRSKIVSAGESAFSEPESKVFRDLILSIKPSAVVLWHSQSNGVYASQCEDGILAGTLKLMNMYSLASGYPAVETFDAYAVTGAADDWLSTVNIPAITVELKTHEDIEFEKNILGIKAIISDFLK